MPKKKTRQIAEKYGYFRLRNYRQWDEIYFSAEVNGIMIVINISSEELFERNPFTKKVGEKMRISDRKYIDRRVRLFIKLMPKGHEQSVPQYVVISEILKANDWFIHMPDTMEQISEEVERRFNFYME